MTTNIRVLAESHLKYSLEGGWFGLPVVLVDPDGVLYDENSNGETLTGQVIYETVIQNPQTGEEITVSKPVISLRISTLIRVPADGEKWVVRIPGKPDPAADLEDFAFSKTRPIETGKSIGFMRIYLQRLDQK